VNPAARINDESQFVYLNDQPGKLFVEQQQQTVSSSLGELPVRIQKAFEFLVQLQTRKATRFEQASPLVDRNESVGFGNADIKMDDEIEEEAMKSAKKLAFVSSERGLLNNVEPNVIRSLVSRTQDLPPDQPYLLTKQQSSKSSVNSFEALVSSKTYFAKEIFPQSQIAFVTPSGSLFSISSILGYREEEKKRRISVNEEPKLRRGVKPISYEQALKRKVREGYDPMLLDDPTLTSGKHRTVMNLPCYMGSVISFVTEKDLRKELNRQFRELHPYIEPSMSLTKIRKIKSLYLQLCGEKDSLMDLSTACLASVYFEKLVLKNLVHKSNRKLFAATCLFIACKFNDIVGKNRDRTRAILEQIIETFSLKSVHEVLSYEFGVFASLDFNLYVDQLEFLPHFKRYRVQRDLLEGNISE
jgi:hypothetical protein